MFAFINSLVPDSVRGAQVLKALRWLATVAGTAVFSFCVAHGFNTTDATAISGAVGGLIIAVGSGIYSLWDAKNVGAKIDAVKVETAQQTAAAVVADPNTAEKIAVTAQSGTPEAAKQVTAILLAGKE